MPTKILEYNLVATDRNRIREEIAHLFSIENPGIGKGKLTSKYIYTVEHFSGCSIQISRPGILKKSFDFSVNIPEIMFLTPGKKDKHHAPSFADVKNILSLYKSNPKVIARIKSLLKALYDCKPMGSIGNLPNATDADGKNYNIGILVLAVKWIFIEEDINYWNWSGRLMFYNYLSRAGLI